MNKKYPIENVISAINEATRIVENKLGVREENAELIAKVAVMLIHAQDTNTNPCLETLHIDLRVDE